MRIALVETAGFANRAVAAVHRIGQDELRPVRLQQAPAFDRGVGREAERDAVAAGRAEHGVGDAGVARGRIEEHAARLERARALAVEDHRQRGAILDRSPRVLRLELRIDLDARSRLEPSQADERRAPDQRRGVRDVADRCFDHRVHKNKKARETTRA